MSTADVPDWTWVAANQSPGAAVTDLPDWTIAISGGGGGGGGGGSQPGLFSNSCVVDQFGASITVPAPVPLNGGEYMLMFFFSGGVPGTTVASSGWSPVVQNTGASATLALLAKVATTSEPANYTVSFPSNTLYCNVVILAYRGASGLDGSAGFSNSGGATTITAPSLTPSGSNRTWVICFDSPDQFSFTGPGAPILRDHCGSGGGGHLQSNAYDEALVSASPTGTAVGTLGSSAPAQVIDVLLAP